MSFYLGLDCGGTKTAAVITDDNGRELGRGLGGPANIANSSDDALRISIRTAVVEARRVAGLRADTLFDAAYAGVAGFSAAERRLRFESILREEASPRDPNALRCRVEPDFVTAYWGATAGEPGIVVIAGTGSVVYGRNARGETHRQDGYGYILGDRGSGFHLGYLILRHTLRQYEKGNRWGVDALAPAVMEATNATSIDGIIEWLYGDFSTAKVAALAPIAGRLADTGDGIAREYVKCIAIALRGAVRRTQKLLDLPRDAPVYELGGLWRIGAFLREQFERPDDPRGTFIVAEPRFDGAIGAALIAIESVRNRAVVEIVSES